MVIMHIGTGVMLVLSLVLTTEQAKGYSASYPTIAYSSISLNPMFVSTGSAVSNELAIDSFRYLRFLETARAHELPQALSYSSDSRQLFVASVIKREVMGSILYEKINIVACAKRHKTIVVI